MVKIMIVNEHTVMHRIVHEVIEQDSDVEIVIDISYRVSPRLDVPSAPFVQIAEQSSETASDTGIRPLTDREREILALIRRGRKNREIATELCIAESTVHKHIQNIFEKLHVRNRTEAIYLTSVEK